MAQKAGVSISTVSRVLNDSSLVKAGTKAKVLQTMEALGYQPSASARSLSLSSTETIALIFPRVSGPFFSEVIQGAEVEARQCQYHLLIYSVHTSQDHEHLLRFLSAKVDGMILAASCVSSAYVRKLEQQHIPFVLLGQEKEGIVADSIMPDNQQGAYDLMTHLIELHRYQRIAFVGQSQDTAHSHARYEGYCQALQRADLSLDATLVMCGDFDESSGYLAMAQLLELSEPPQAVFFANDQMALGALAAAREKNVRIPDDVAVVGFDDIQMATYVQPPLTTVRQEIRQQGVLTVQRLLERIGNPDLEARTVVLPTQLVVRRSCGCSVPV
ncbi:MAG: LacI family DNA-binding transcriptional regulator [Anaerolineae bacterium]|nr:LacI family DNA-binding transcriptional regulator [Anaerolineae bacterium]